MIKTEHVQLFTVTKETLLFWGEKGIEKPIEDTETYIYNMNAKEKNISIIDSRPRKGTKENHLISKFRRLKMVRYPLKSALS